MQAGRAVRGYVGAVMHDCPPDRITAVTELAAGENHAVFRVSYVGPPGDARDVVVRIATSEYASDCPTAEREATALRKAGGFGAPQLYDFRCESAWFDRPVMCMQFVDGDQRAPIAADDFERLGALVGWLHALPTDDLEGWKLPATTTAAAYLDARLTKIDEKLSSVRDPLPALVQKRLLHVTSRLRDSLDLVRSADVFQVNDPLVLLHGDVAGGNIFWTPEPVLIDWEYARIGDAADEVAYIFNQNGFSGPQREVFWRGYQRSRGPAWSLEAVIERVRLWEPVTVLGSTLFWTQLWTRRADADLTGRDDPAVPRAQDYYREQTIWRLERAEALLDRHGA
jgi:aminoglycoside phosphotransferase (APT) family kinase protein